MINWLIRKKTDKPIHVTAGDEVVLIYRAANGQTTKIRHPVVTKETYDTMAIGEIQNELGFEAGIVAAIGR